MLTADDLRQFAQDVAEAFNRGDIRAPIHLDGGNEDQLIDVFKTIDRRDWVCGSWRMMSKCLLHGVPRDELLKSVLAGHSITLCFPEHRILSSAIVGGILPIALGIAWQIKRRAERAGTPAANGGSERVHCFVGDMSAATGLAHECWQYALNFDLPVRWIVENNGKSVCSPTAETWGGEGAPYDGVEHYSYDLTWPHSGAGRRVEF